MSRGAVDAFVAATTAVKVLAIRLPSVLPEDNRSGPGGIPGAVPGLCCEQVGSTRSSLPAALHPVQSARGRCFAAAERGAAWLRQRRHDEPLMIAFARAARSRS